MKRKVALLSAACFLPIASLIVVSADDYWNLYAYQGKIIRAPGWEHLGNIGWQKSEVWPTPRITDHKCQFSGSGASGIWHYVFPWKCMQTLTYHNENHNDVCAWCVDMCQYSLYMYAFLGTTLTGFSLGSYTTTSEADVFP